MLFLQREPTEWPRVKKMKEKNEVKDRDGSEGRRGSGAGGAWQTWRVNGTRCPKGSIPVRRSTVNDVLRAKSLFDFGKKRRPILLDRQMDAPDVVSGNGHEVAYLFLPHPTFFLAFKLKDGSFYESFTSLQLYIC